MNNQREQNLESPHVGVRWQAELEEHLEHVRSLTSEALLPGVLGEQIAARTGLAQAHATAALALSIGLVGSDLEIELTELRG